MNLILSLALAILPAGALLYRFLRDDRYPEPRAVVAMTFLLGVLITLPVLPLALMLLRTVPGSVAPWADGLAHAFLGAAIPEESLKYLVLTGFCLRHQAFDEAMDGIVYGVTVSLGFATIENVLYVQHGGIGLALARAVTTVPAHAFLGVIMGFHIGHAHVSRGSERRRYYWKALWIPVLLHGLYDAPLMIVSRLSEPPAGTIVLALGSLMATLITMIAVGNLAHFQYRRAQLERFDAEVSSPARAGTTSATQDSPHA